MGSRKKRQDKKKDFVKPKLRVGKTAAKPNNFTDTSFKSKSISLRQQITSSRDKTSETELQHLFSLLKHHSFQSRKEVLIKLKSIIEKLNNSNTFPYDELLTKLKPLVLDSNSTVRESVLDLLTTISKVQPNILNLHQGSLILFILSAMSHIDNSIRNDSIKFFSILLNTSNDVADSIIRSNWAKLLKAFMQIMNFSIDGKVMGSKGVSFSVTTGSSVLSSSSSFKKSQEKKQLQLKTFYDFIFKGCLLEKRELQREEENRGNPENDDQTIRQTHQLTDFYMMSTKTNPYGHLKLFTRIGVSESSNQPLPQKQQQQQAMTYRNKITTTVKKENGKVLINVDGLSSEDIISRRKILIEIFFDGLLKGLQDINKDEKNELKKLSGVFIEELTEIKEDYELDLLS